MTLFDKDSYTVREFYAIVINNSILKDVPQDEIADFMTELNIENIEEIYDKAFLDSDMLYDSLTRISEIKDKKECAMQLGAVLLTEVFNDYNVIGIMFMMSTDIATRKHIISKYLF
jgi:hypothetical protein